MGIQLILGSSWEAMPLSYYIGPTGCACVTTAAESAGEGDRYDRRPARVTSDPGDHNYDTDEQEDDENWNFPPTIEERHAWWFECCLADYEARIRGYPPAFQ